MFFLEADPAQPSPPNPKMPVFSTSDLVASAQCEFSVLHILDQKLGRVPRTKPIPDESRARAAALGEAHEARVLAGFIKEFGRWDGERGVYEVHPAQRYERELLEEKHRESLAALKAGADVVFQASFFDGSFHGRADFLIKQPSGAYRVVDTKLARSARVTALLQLAAYADQLQQAGIEVDRQVQLILGNGVQTLHDVQTIAPVFEEKRERLLTLVALQAQDGMEPVRWSTDPAYGFISRCGTCDECLPQVAEHRDMLLTQGMTVRTRNLLVERYGITGIDQLAQLAGTPALGGQVRKYAEQAALQTGVAQPDATVTFTHEGEEKQVSYKLLPKHSLHNLPRASAGDLFISVRSDGLWQDGANPGSQYTWGLLRASHGRRSLPSGSQYTWGLHYLLGITYYPDSTSGEPECKTMWAHSRAEERQLLLTVLTEIHQRTQEHPGLHLYHFGSQLKYALRELTTRHNLGEDYLADVLRNNVLVDLSEASRQAMRVSSGTHRLAGLEPLYMEGQLRPFEIPDGAYTDLVAARAEGKGERAEAITAALEGDARFDGVSLIRLRNWLLSLAGRNAWGEASQPAPLVNVDDLLVQAGKDERESQIERSLRLFVEGVNAPGALEAQKEAVAMVASATGYHRRERHQFWWEHFDRLTAPVEDWDETRDVLIFERLAVEQDWHKPAGARSLSRVLGGVARLAPGSSVKVGDKNLFAMYARPLPEFLQRQTEQQALEYAALHEGVLPAPAERAGAFNVEVLALDELEGQDGAVQVRLRESLRGFGGEPPVPYRALPMALTPSTPIPTKAQEDSLMELAARTAQCLPELPQTAGTDLLLRVAPRLKDATGNSKGGLPRAADFAQSHGSMATVEAIYSAVSSLDRSFVAVQGPPGSGKTFVGSHVIGQLVRSGWKVGIVAQSHAVVENMLAGCIKNGGVDPQQVAKVAGKSQMPDFPWQEVENRDVQQFMNAAGGRIFGGTAWDFASDRKFRAESLDLLVIDEAGQYSLANTLAVARSAKNLLLLGDPAQLPQVTQGAHPYPVDESALGWLSSGRTVLPEQFGYFLDVSWRMHPALCAPVSQLSYEGRLGAAAAGSERHLDGWAPGVYVSEIPHTGNSTFSHEEAAEVVRLAQLFIGHLWTPGAGQASRPLAADDLIVVAAYNAQVEVIQEALLTAGLSGDDGGVRVGTVDKFQGQEAPVVLVSMAASSAGDSPRGTDFLLSSNRLNVALSRGMWAAVIIKSERFTHFLPGTPEALMLLGGFTRLTRQAQQVPSFATTPLIAQREDNK
ncbi:MAG: AAA domain-containing protein [Rothia sp. (in: high G+C Gram-positive bacteria)]|nr:AAA domain-containing protein [Rothia sp. (in: high G+C Gram-positive bacteria)]